MTLGCKVNQYETQAIESILKDGGHEMKIPGEGCDVCIINTCAVTAESVRKSRQAIRRMKKLEPEAIIAVYGCFSQLEPESVAKLKVDIISGTSDRLEFAQRVEDTGTVLLSYNKTRGRFFCPPGGNTKTRGRFFCPPDGNTFEELPPGSASNRTRALLKIQDGCDNYCAYCVVPYARGRSRSLPLSRMAEYAKQLEEQGYKEIVITGIEISSYGKDFSQPPLTATPSLITAIRTISSAAPNTRLRLGSLDPTMLTDEFIIQLRDIPNLCDHFHISLQSGCDETLRRMGRKYNTKHVQKAIDSIRNYFKECGITADLITGFPGEAEVDFNRTMAFIKKAAFSEMHIFPYSPRPGTKAEGLPNQIDKKIKKERAQKAAAIAKTNANNFKQSQIGKTTQVLFEQEKGGFYVGHSSNYLEIVVKEKVEKNSIHNVKISAIKNNILTGEVIRLTPRLIESKMLNNNTKNDF